MKVSSALLARYVKHGASNPREGRSADEERIRCIAKALQLLGARLPDNRDTSAFVSPSKSISGFETSFDMQSITDLEVYREFAATLSGQAWIDTKTWRCVVRLPTKDLVEQAKWLLS